MASTMRAAQWTSSAGGIEKHMRTTSVPTPQVVSTGCTLIKVNYATLNPVDYKFAESFLIGRLINRTPGSDFAGTVVSSTYPDLTTGDAVFGLIDPPSFGALAEYVLVKGRQNVVHMPDGVDQKDAAALGVVALTAYQSIVPFVKAGDKIFINGGSGGVGTFGIQIAKAIGCYVTVTCSGANVDLCKRLGADETIDYQLINVVEHLKRQGTQYSLLFDTVGTPAIYYSAHHYLKENDLFVTIAIDPTSFVSIRQTLTMFVLPGFLGGGQRQLKFVGAQADLVALTKLAQWLEQGRIKTHIDQEYRLEQAGEAFAKLKTGRTRGKIIVKVSDD